MASPDGGDAMLRTLAEPEGYKLTASDGDIGRCSDFLFEDAHWTIRYMVVETGAWLSSRKVLVLAAFLESPDWYTRRFPVRLTRRQIKDSPPLDSDAPVSRRYERAYHDFFTMPYYWMGNGLWGNYPIPGTLLPPDLQIPPSVALAEPPEPPEDHPEAIHLRSLREVTGYRVAASDGEVGRILDFVVEDRTWALEFAVVDTSLLPPSKKVLVAVDRIEEVRWAERLVRLGLDRDQVARAPEFDPRAPVNEALEVQLYDYCGRPRGRATEEETAGHIPALVDETDNRSHDMTIPGEPVHRRVLMAFFADGKQAAAALETLIAKDFPMDRISLLGKAASSGDDPLGVYYANVGERMRGWGKLGAFWGGLWGLLAGAAGLFVVPGIGPLLAAGPVVEALAGAAGGAAVTGGVLAGAGAASEFTVAAHRMGVPEERLQETRDLLARGEHLLMIIVAAKESERWGGLLADSQADPLWTFPYFGLADALKKRT